MIGARQKTVKQKSICGEVYILGRGGCCNDDAAYTTVFPLSKCHRMHTTKEDKHTVTLLDIDPMF